ncbi:MAG TPA: dihydropteroate synthase [Fibrobacteres bacterium]|nr:dihydropteroate synthase [Fibrobacterota bacterium]
MIPRPWRIKDRLLGGERPLIMGILNVTPDSFHDGGKYTSVEAALRRCEEMLSEGADLVDVGGERPRPAAEPVPEAEERSRVVPVIEAIAKRFDQPISIDTMKSGVARAALESGASIINDVSAMTFDPLMLDVPQGFGAAVVLNHMRGAPRTMQQNPGYENVVREVRDFLSERVRLLASLGVSKDRIAVDPGIGFGKRLEDNYTLIEHLEEFDVLGCPVLLGHSHKSFIGKTPGLENSDRLHPSVAISVYALLKGASILRVHDVKATFEALRMVESIRKSGFQAPGA